jgi:hypothetical protein
MKRVVALVALLTLAGCIAKESTGRNIAPANLVAQQAQPCATAAPAVLCIAVTVTPGGSGLVTATPNATPLATVTATQGQSTPTQIAVATSTPAPTINPTTAPNLLKNGGFEPPFVNRQHADGNYHIIADFWTGYYCDGCAALRQGTGAGTNPQGLTMGRPEYKPASAGGQAGKEWKSGVSGQQWFCFFRSCRAGVLQTVTVPPGADCEVRAWVRSWSNYDNDPLSELDTQDDRDNSQWVIRVDPTGGTIWNAAHVLVSQNFGGSYDTWSEIRYSFAVAKDSTRVTVFFENLRLWPIANNDSYADGASLRCQ